MQQYIYPPRSEWEAILKRPLFDTTKLHETVSAVLNQIRTQGDSALLELEKKFDKVELDSLQVSSAEIEEASNLVSEDLKQAIREAKKNIELFHQSQIFVSQPVETTSGVTCWQKAVPIEKVGLYVPGGSAPLFSTVLMLAIPAKIAGCREITLCSPPNSEGKIHPAILFAAQESGVNRIFKLGGIQAIGAMAYGTESVPKSFKIFGPGNQYVMAAKQLISLRDAAIDMPAGPSEVEVLADETANAAFVAADLLSQAEHGADSQVVLVTTSEKLIEDMKVELEKQTAALSRSSIAEKALENSRIILLKTKEEMIELTNLYAPEHLIIEMDSYTEWIEEVVNAGSVFLGHYTPESAGDYASGTNHTLPTNGYATAYSGVNLDSFIKKITFQEITKQGIQNLGKTIEIMAENEELTAHKNAVTLRLQSLK